MIYIVCSFELEARAVIEQFGLENIADSRFPVYRSEDISLVISGIGKTASAAATAFLLTDGDASSGDICVNIGFCGASNLDTEIGEFVHAVKILDEGNAKSYVPGTIELEGCKQGIVACVDCPAGSGDRERLAGLFVDMESAGFFRAARCFLPAKQIFVMKTVSDLLLTERQSNEFYLSLMKNNIGRICESLLRGDVF